VTKRGLLIGVLAAVLLGLTVPTLAYMGHGRATGRERPFTWGAVGDSITYGVGSSDRATKAYPVQAGIAGRGVAGQCLVALGCSWQPLVETFPSELANLQHTDDVDAVAVEIGVNDLGRVTDQQYVDAYARLKAEGAAQGVRVVLSTITPFGRAHDFSSVQEQQRERINTWIRGQDAYVDYDAALRSGLRLRSQYDCGDGQHPNDAGYARMAQALDRWIARDG
jgi:lysophospholipase L1-like esterase